MDVLLDTNIYLTDPTFNKPEFKVLGEYLKRTHSRLLLPDIIKKETEKNLYAKGYTDYRSVRNTLASQIGLLRTLNKEDISINLIERFHKIIETLPVNDLSSNGITLSTMIDKSLQERAPFKSEGKGFRDALIWEITLEFIKTDKPQQIAIVTNNYKDFGANGKFHSSMSEDLAIINETMDVHYYQDLGSFLTIHSAPTEFVNEKFISEHLDLEVIAIGQSTEPADIQVGTQLNGAEYGVAYGVYNEYEISSFYILSEDETYTTVYVETVLYFFVELKDNIALQEYDPIHNDYGIGSEELYDEMGWREVNFEVKVDKRTETVSAVHTAK